MARLSGLSIGGGSGVPRLLRCYSYDLPPDSWTILSWKILV
jgi:hypothetical protein